MEYKIEKQSVKEVHQAYGRSGMFRAIEAAAKVTTQMDRIAEDAEKWVNDRLIKSGHMRPLEFGTVYLQMPVKDPMVLFFSSNHYSKVVVADGQAFITTNYRVLVESKCEYLIDTDAFCLYNNTPSPHHVRRRCLLWNISRGVADEFRTHVSISSMMESTRYCDYTKDKFDGLTFISPIWYEKGDRYTESEMLEEHWENTNDRYEKMLALGMKPQQAKEMLPLSIRVHFIQCAFESDWYEFFCQRAWEYTGKAQPEAKVIALQAASLLKIAE